MRFFHGTSTARLTRICQEGLSHPFLTDHADLAHYYAKMAAERSGGDPMVLSINVLRACALRVDSAAFEEPIPLYRNLYAQTDREWLSKLDNEVDGLMWPDGDRDWRTSLRVTWSVLYKGTIPPTQIAECRAGW